jgi:uncharacterized protein (TIGR02757 family)
MTQATQIALLDCLNEYHDRYNVKDFIENDPVSIPHRYTLKQDQEIMGFFAAILAWGLRKTTIASCERLGQLFDGAPYQFITQHRDSDLRRFSSFVHRTFQPADFYAVLSFFKAHYTKHNSLETAFLPPSACIEPDITQHLIHFHNYFFSLTLHLPRTRKHIATPDRNSACKRLCMYLRWMVRSDSQGVDLGLWKQISMAQLVCPLDVHVLATAVQLNLIPPNKSSWQTAIQLTEVLRNLDHFDPVRYDFALFGLSQSRHLHHLDLTVPSNLAFSGIMKPHSLN